MQFTDLTTGGTVTSWNWTFQGGSPASSTDQNPKVLFGTRGTYDVSLTVDDGSGQVSETKVDYIDSQSPLPQPSTITGVTNPCEDDVETYNVSNFPLPRTFYTWTLPATWAGASGTSSIITTVGSTGGNIEVTADNACGSSTPRTLAVTVCTPVSINELNKKEINIYPNPAQNTIHISGVYNNNNIGNKEVKIIDVLGKTIYSSIINSTNYQIDVSELSRGVYFIQLNDNKLISKFIKE
ncbi:MAG: T9SS type A sorting domain-containing protein [Vicingus serpentipes]|nr:T9SS type A sorting domain-containing protein [Vicingus serpentipes]